MHALKVTNGPKSLETKHLYPRRVKNTIKTRLIERPAFDIKIPRNYRDVELFRV